MIYKHKGQAIILSCLIICISACFNGEISTFQDGQGHYVKATIAEIHKKQEFLLNAKYPDDIPKSAKGSVIFDGKVLSTTLNQQGIHVTTFEIAEKLYGTLPNKDEVIIMSPDTTKGGIIFIVGEKYRVFTVKINNCYRTWDWTGTVKLPK